MANHETRDYFGRRKVRHVVNATVSLLGLAALGYLAAPLVGQSLPPRSAASATANQAAIGSGQTATNADAASPLAPTATAPNRDFDYFPDHYVNQATKAEEPIPTF
jgi:hypothetical protein